VLPLDVAAIEHRVGYPRSFEIRIGTMPTDQEVRGAPNVELGSPVRVQIMPMVP
jgi:hypothetical protein